MKKKPLVISAIAVIAIFGAVVAYMVYGTRHLSPEATATYNVDGLNITVDYCRPSKQGRMIFGDAKDGALQPNGRYWRLGANDATEIAFSQDVNFAGEPVKAGRYRMYAILNESSWDISLNTELGAFGAIEPNHALDVLKVAVPVEKVAEETEMFTIAFVGDSTAVNMHMNWDKTHVAVPIRNSVNLQSLLLNAYSLIPHLIWNQKALWSKN